MSMVGFPLLLIPLAIYNIIVFLMPGVSFAEPLVKLTLMSGAEWPVTLSDMLLALGILLLLFEVIKGARPGAKYLTDHLLSLIVFGGCGGRIPAVAAVRHLDLFPADAAGAGGFPVGHCAARTARNGAVSRCGLRRERPSARRCARTSNSSPRRRRRCRQPLRSPNPRCWIAPSRKWRMPTSRRRDHRRRSRPRDCSPATARRRRRTRRRANFRSIRI